MFETNTIGKSESLINEILPGGSDPMCFDRKEAWYPVHYVKDLDKSKPTPFTLLDRDIVIWWDRKAKSWRIFEDRCPHRLAPLSEGRISDDGFLECPYHGWAFSGDGICQRIPQQIECGTAETSKRACAASLPTTERQGLLFVYVGKPENAAKTKVPVIESLEASSEEWVVIKAFRDLPYDALTLLENLLDPSHASFAHHRTLGNRANAEPVELEIIESSKHGFKGIWKQGQHLKLSGKQSTTFVAPSLIYNDLYSQDGTRIITIMYAIPIRKGECRWVANFFFKLPSRIPSLLIKLIPPWFYHIGQNSVIEDDQIFLHYQERYFEAKGDNSNFAKAFYLPTKADSFVFQLRQWVQQYNAEPFPGQSFSPLLPKKQLLERYHSHTLKCASCRSALARIQQLRFWCGIVAVLALTSTSILTLLFDITSVLKVVIETVIPLVFGAAWFGLSKLEKQFYDGRLVPPRNLPDNTLLKDLLTPYNPTGTADALRK